MTRPASSASTSSPFHIFGIRHHGPGCARTLVRALQALQPDCLLVEGPPEGNETLRFIVHEQMAPPVALLVHASDDASNSVFYPFAEFSPEWQALRWAVGQGVPARFMDLPVGVSLALRAGPGTPEAEAPPPEADASTGTPAPAGEPAAPEGETADEGQAWSDDPLTSLALAAGYSDGEAWWNHMVEERGDGRDLFQAIAEAMRALREHLPHGARRDEADIHREALREAHMRQTLRQAAKEGFQRIAVVCGAWHVPALEASVPAKGDAALLKGLARIKTSATWVPWTYPHLARSSGYGAGIRSPGWYEHLWRHDEATSSRAVGWLARVARLLRERDIDCSSAHIIEAVRLAETLGALRGRPAPGLEEIDEALLTVVCNGNRAPLDLIQRDLTIGDRLGRVPEEVPTVPLQQDMEQTQRRLRLKPQAFAKTLELDLRTDTDLARSILLHRLRILGIPWGELRGAGASRGTFKEVWELQWRPEFSVAIIEASRWGATLAGASGARLIDTARQSDDLAALATAVDDVLLADLRGAVGPISATLEERASLTGDVVQLLGAIAPLANVHRYGSVRNFDTAVVARVLDGVIVRAGIGLPPACASINEDLALALRGQLLGAHAAIALRQDEALAASWRQALVMVARSHSAHALLRGAACRLLFDEKAIGGEEVTRHLSMNLSMATDALQASAWLDGFLNRNALVLLHDAAVWGLVDDWVATLSPEHFVSVLPLVRRTFAAFPAADRHDLGLRAAKGAGKAAARPAGAPWHEERAALVLPILSKILGVAA